jgi:hypothetical protein
MMRYRSKVTLEGLCRAAKAEFDRVDEAYQRKLKGVGCPPGTRHFITGLNSVAGGDWEQRVKELKVNPKGSWFGYRTEKCLVCGTYFISDYVGKYPKKISPEQAAKLGYGIL